MGNTQTAAGNPVYVEVPFVPKYKDERTFGPSCWKAPREYPETIDVHLVDEWAVGMAWMIRPATLAVVGKTAKDELVVVKSYKPVRVAVIR